MSYEEGTEKVAVVGISLRVPGAETAARFWENLCNGVSSITTLDQAQLTASGIPEKHRLAPEYVPRKGIIEDPACFDASFFGIGAAEALLMDPQHRLCLETCHAVLESAGYRPDLFEGRIGVFVGAGMNTYLWNHLYPAILEGRAPVADAFQVMIGAQPDFLSTRIAYKLNLTGPALDVQSACSTSLIAVHLACESLLCFDTDMVLAGGVSIGFPHNSGYLYQEGGILSPDGYCRAFDQAAAGTVSGNGVAMVALKRLEDAHRDGDTIFALIRGSAVNNDGGRKVGYTAPSVSGQAEVLTRALTAADLEPEAISYIECHGTGTKLGDPIEIEALRQVYGNAKAIGLGSVKTNIGHLDAAAGIVGLIKVALALKHRLLPPSLHFNKPNPELELDQTPFHVVTKTTPWQASRPLRAGVSAFGIGGNNAHVILEEPPEPEPPELAPGESCDELQLLRISAQTPAALKQASAQLSVFLRENPNLNPADVAYTLDVGRGERAYRRFVVCRSSLEAADTFEHMETQYHVEKKARVIFLFPGMGSFSAAACAQLYSREPLFREAVDRCCLHLTPLLGKDLRAFFNNPSPLDLSAEMAMVFTGNYALACWWMNLGIEPVAMLGHSVGEYVAAHLAGVFSLEDILHIIVQRGELVSQMGAGAMLSVLASRADLVRFLDDTLEIAVENGPANYVVSGRPASVKQLEERLRGAEIPCRPLKNTAPFHASLLDPILDRFADMVACKKANPPNKLYISTLTGTWIQPEEVLDPQFWVRHLRRPVQFSKALETAFALEDTLLLEVGCSRVLSGMVVRHPSRPLQKIVCSSLFETEETAAALLKCVGNLWARGVAIDWRRIHGDRRRKRIPLPTYPFARTPYLVQAGEGVPRSQGKHENPTEWFRIPSWKASLPPNQPLPPGSWLVCHNQSALAQEVVDRLREQGRTVYTLTMGELFKARGHAFELRPDRVEDYSRLFQSIGPEGQRLFVLHFWCLDPVPETHDLERDTQRGYGALLRLGQALAVNPNIESADLTVVSNGLYPPHVNPGKATLLGPCLVLPQEYPNISCKSVDLEPPDLGEAHSLVPRLLAEACHAREQPIIQFRRGERLIRSWEEAPLAGDSPAIRKIRKKGVYLITGGLGRLGLLTAAYLAEQAPVRLVLLGRSPFPPRGQWPAQMKEGQANRSKIQNLLDLEKLGAQLMLLQANIADEGEMTAALTHIKNEFGALDGVFHTAGIASGADFARPFGEVDEQQTQAQFEAKIRGVLVLQKLLPEHQPDFILLCSSISVVLGGLGLCAYAAANLFMDHLATNPERALPWMVLDWEGLLPAGAALDHQAGPYALDDRDIKEVLQRVIQGADVPRLAVAGGDLDTRLKRWVSASAQPPENATWSARPTLSCVYQEPVTPTEKSLARIWQAHLGLQEIGVRDDFFELGGDSLIAVKLLAVIRRTFKVHLGVHDLLHAPTIEELSGLMETPAAKGDAPSRLIKLQAGEPGYRPLFLIHPVGGSVYFYRALARELGGHRPVYGLQARGLDGEARIETDLKQMAEDYLKAIRLVFPQGPYHLGGSSFGGVVAYQMACRLAAMGEPPGVLCLIDSAGPGQLPENLTEEPDILRYMAAGLEHHADYEAAFVLGDLASRRQFILAHHFGTDDQENMTAALSRFLEIFQANMKALVHFQPEDYDGDLLFFSATTRRREYDAHQPHRYWVTRVKSLQNQLIPGTHITINDRPGVTEIAQTLHARLSEFDQPYRG